MIVYIATCMMLKVIIVCRHHDQCMHGSATVLTYKSDMYSTKLEDITHQS